MSSSVLPTYQGKRAYQPLSKECRQDWDVIVIGTGLGGLACAATLSRYGRRVLLLEQHYLPGGYTHMFGRKGWKWDSGVHIIGEMSRGEMPARLLKWLSGGQIAMNRLATPYDRFLMPDGDEVALPESKRAYQRMLFDRFPSERDKLKRYFRRVEGVALYARLFFLGQSLPQWADRLLSGVAHLVTRDWWSLTTGQVLDELDIQGRLRTVLTHHWGYYGSVPSRSSFPVHALTHTHFWNGAYYPSGGATEFASHLLGTVLEGGGECRTRAEVAQVLIDGGKAVGVEMANGQVFRAPQVVSAAGAKNTVKRLLPEPFRSSSWAGAIGALPNSPPYLCLYLGFEGEIEKVGATSGNVWLYEVDHNEATYWVPAQGEKPPILFVSFPSLKDPQHQPGPNHRHTGECITFLPWDEVARWSSSQLKERPEEYETFKAELAERMLECLRRRLPGVMEKLVYWELSTPLSANHFARADQGAIYGLEASPERFRCQGLRTRTPVRNLTMAGVDVAAVGVVSAMVSGVLAAATIEPRAYLRLI